MKIDYLNIIKFAFLLMFIFIGLTIFTGLYYERAGSLNVWVSASKVVEDVESHFSKVNSNYAGEIIDYNNEIPICDSKNSRMIILRLDDVKAWQYYDITTRMTSLILSKNMAFTMAVIPKDIEKDTTLFLPWIRNIKNDERVEIALHGYLHEEGEFKDLNRTEATDRLQKGKELIYNYTGIVPVTFIPPENEYSDDTVDALSDTGFRVISAEASPNIKQYYEIGENLSFVGYTTRTYDFSDSGFIPAEQVLKECSSSLNKDGLCVIMIHPQDYLTADRTKINEERYAEFVKLIDGLGKLNASFKNFKDLADCKI